MGRDLEKLRMINEEMESRKQRWEWLGKKQKNGNWQGEVKRNGKANVME